MTRLPTVVVGAVTAVTVSLFCFVSAVPTSGVTVSFCHATSSVHNPYNLITTDADSIIQQGHGSHTGPVYPTDNWGDIIPPFDYTGGRYPGLNWPDGAAILQGGCATHVIEAPPNKTTTPLPSTSLPGDTLPGDTLPGDTLPGDTL